MNKTTIYSVPEISSGHCRAAIVAEVGSLDGVTSVEVDLEEQRVTVRGPALDDHAIRAAIYEAGYDAEPLGPADTSAGACARLLVRNDPLAGYARDDGRP